MISCAAVIFDLDGTLLDTLRDIAEAMNASLNRLGFPEHAVDRYRLFVGSGLDLLAQQALPADRRDRETVRLCIAAMRQEYSQRWARTTRPYEGIAELLAGLKTRGIPSAVLSNKAHEFTVKAVERFFGAGSFAIVLGQSDDFPIKPDPAAALHIAARLALPPGAICFVGDSGVDMKTAQNAGMHAVGVTWGFRTKQELLASGVQVFIDKPEELLVTVDRGW